MMKHGSDFRRIKDLTFHAGKPSPQQSQGGRRIQRLAEGGTPDSGSGNVPAPIERT